MTEKKTPAIYAAMHNVMLEVKGLAKRDRNDHHKFHFRGIDATVNALGPALRDHGVVVTPNVTGVDYVQVTTSGGKPSTSCRVLVDYVFYAVADGSSIIATVAGESVDQGDKATPKAMSVAFRTALLQTFALPTDEIDPDAQSYEQERPAPATPEQVNAVGKALGEQGLLGEGMDATRNKFLADTLGRKTEGGDLLAAEVQPLLDALAQRGPTAEQTAMLEDSLGAKPVDGGEK